MSGSGDRRVWVTDPVARIMMWPVATVDADDSLWLAAESLAADEIGALGVLKHGRLVGVMSERDVVRHVAEKADPEHLTAGEVMTTDVVRVRPGDTVLAVAAKMLDAGVRHLPVLDDEDRIAGFVSVRDVLQVLVDAVGTDDVIVVPSGSRVVVRGE